MTHVDELTTIRPDARELPLAIRPNVIAALGNTPLVRLNAVTRGIRTPVVAKLEMLNPGGSVKDRIGIRMIEAAERDGLAQTGRHDRRADLRQHRCRAGDGRRRQAATTASS